MSELIVPEDMWEGDTEGVLVCWTFGDGAEVKQGEVVAEVMVEKAQMELCAPVTGILRHKAREEDLVRGGDVIGSID